ncbi:putative MFS family arabinose efflux permease [Pseudonocardia endophytica]|uniref:Putative MFS family arabinose efflux permease n=1 Tax=Pseudonocardia endophytica TaxID=401976 RepID=A0A4R1HXD4_PSEEN|nr:putative MFS family arabinose efflux permease [Pseudonocardia endophytica]
MATPTSSEPTTSAPTARTPETERPGGTRNRRVLAATVAAQSIEYYDFLIYGTAATLALNSQFFPSVDPVVGVLAAFATFAVGFAGRPIGAAIFGHLGDRYGRKPALLGAIMLMAASTLLIGLLPTYAVIGLAAPVLLTVMRVLQGISVGGQWGGATLLALENAPPNRRALYGSLPQLGVVVGLVGGTLVFLLVNSLTTPEQFAAWGWRIPFLLTVLMFPVAFVLHRYVEDSPEFRRAETAIEERRSQSSVVRTLRNPKQMLLVVFGYLPATISFYVIATGMIDYGTRELGLPKNTMLTAVMLSMIAFGVGTVGGAWVADVIGHRKVYGIGAALAGLWMFALFPLVETRSFGLIVLGASVGQLAVGLMFGPGTAIWAAMFPPETRYAGVSLGTQFSNIIGGGLAPFIMVALFAATGTSLSTSAYVAVAAVLSLIALMLIRLPAREAKERTA